ncbi:MAG TPA: hypothetical protein PKY30_16300 [Myxococcota bacterium]|nr:hypothetical protein [Myxococcota bacterium]HND28792.1 hypothetical protein [Myxococcota bacterium]HNH48603.1 hypothetical protein [Myxococcota bacterium]
MRSWTLHAHRPPQLYLGMGGVVLVELFGTLLLVVAWGDQNIPAFMLAGLFVALVMPLWLVLKVVTREVELQADEKQLTVRTTDGGPLEDWGWSLPWTQVRGLSWSRLGTSRLLLLDVATGENGGLPVRIALHDQGVESGEVEKVLRAYLERSAASSLRAPT